MTSRSGRFDAVCFDCDSTLSTIEGIDELASRAGLAHQIAPLTQAAMDGELTIDAVYARRLEMIRPDRAAIDWLGERYVATIVEGGLETIRALKERDVAVHIVSGGLRPALLPLAAALGIDEAQVYAVDVLFDAAGHYVDFDRASPLSFPDGKARICRMLAADHRSIALVGDGVTDVAARAGGAFVIGFGGVARREAVVAGADAFADGPSLTSVLPLLTLAS